MTAGRFTQSGEHVRSMFGQIALRYDLANHVLSCGCDFYWRRQAVKIVAGWQPRRILDLASGTGDLALVLQKRLPTAEITGADFSQEMLAIAKQKGVRQAVVADIMALPFAAESFDAVTIAFGLRNLEDWSAGVHEMLRVLKPGGHLLVLDFSLPQSPILRALYRFYLHRILPPIAAILTKKRDAYEYLGSSIEEFPRGEAMLQLIESAGFANAKAEPLSGGIVTIYAAVRSLELVSNFPI